MNQIGHNSMVQAERLKSIVERIEDKEGEIKLIREDISDLYKESKANGFDTKGLRELIKRRKLGEDKWEEREAILDTYARALGMIP
jgi:uncharacterized protein (UPF0335 family)